MMSTTDILMKSASQNHGLTLTSWQVRNLAQTIINYDRRLAAVVDLLGEYMEKYGEEYAQELAGVIVEGEIIDDTETTEDRLPDDGGGVDSPLEGEESGPVLEVSDEDVS